jgi:hypothetical protein
MKTVVKYVVTFLGMVACSYIALGALICAAHLFELLNGKM